MMRIVSALVLIVMPVVVAAGPYDGRYYPSGSAVGWDCKTIGMDGGALAIADTTFFGVESRCSLTQATPVRDMGATLYDMICSGEGDTWSNRVMIMSTAEGVAMIRDGNVSLLTRCE